MPDWSDPFTYENVRGASRGVAVTIPAPVRHVCRQPKYAGMKRVDSVMFRGGSADVRTCVPTGALWRCGDCGLWWVKNFTGVRTPRTAHMPDWVRVRFWHFGLRRRIRQQGGVFNG